jgi:hypothetical protein
MGRIPQECLVYLDPIYLSIYLSFYLSIYSSICKKEENRLWQKKTVSKYDTVSPASPFGDKAFITYT